MLFWIICAMIALCAIAYLAVPMLRPREGIEHAPDVAIYKAQLAEIDRDLARDLLAPDEAERARTEVARRLLTASKAGDDPASAGPTRGAVIGTGVLVCAVSAVTYLGVGAPGEPDQPLAARLAIADEMRENRPSQAALVAAAPTPPPVDAPQNYRDTVAQLREIAPTRPDDLQAWELLAFHETELRNFAAAAEAQARVLALRGDEATQQDRILLVDLMVTAANGFVSPEAEDRAREILKIDEQSIAARYYLGAVYDQTDRPDIAFRIWRPLVESGADTYHVALARAQIAGTAARAGVTYNPPEVRGPGLDQIAAAEDMSPEDRAAMIGGMVAGLADRLATQGGPASDWARLIRAYGVLGETETARMVWTEARDVFGADAGSMALLTEAATAAGVAE